MLVYFMVLEEFDGVNIIINYTSKVLDVLLKNIKDVPATLGTPYITRGDISTRLHVPIKFEPDVDKRYGRNPLYNERQEEIVFNGAINKRMLELYGSENNRDLNGQRVMIKTEVLEDTIHTAPTIMLYSLYNPLEKKLSISKPFTHIINPDVVAVDMLFRNFKAFPACIYSISEPKRRPGSTDFTLYFNFHDNIARNFASLEYNMTLNSVGINSLMWLLDVDEPDGILGKSVAVYTYQDLYDRKVVICGMTSLQQYHTRSVKL